MFFAIEQTFSLQLLILRWYVKTYLIQYAVSFVIIPLEQMRLQNIPLQS